MTKYLSEERIIVLQRHSSGVADILHSKSRTKLHVSTPGIHSTQVKNSKVTFLVGSEHTHVKVNQGQLIAVAGTTGETHKLSAGDEVVILHGNDSNL